ncbi:MAG TPA: GGDEF-domain containing protein [Lachnospiraceae bacterium]|nr:GGDEF-domain containing protein [Lachnospiraceae bacterium]
MSEDVSNINCGGVGEMKKRSVSESLDRMRSNKAATIVGFVMLLLLHTVVTAFVTRMSRSDTMLMIGGVPTPLRAFTGALSNVGNLCLILLVVFYGRVGTIVTLFVLAGQFPVLFMGIFAGHQYTNISGVFTNLFAIVATMLIYFKNRSITKYQEKIRSQAITDLLTGIPNRFACTELVEGLIRQKGRFSVATINLNNFKNINNTMGVKTGNAVLSEVASRLQKASEEGHTGTDEFVTRQGGDEFTIIIHNYPNEKEIVRTINYYKSVLEQKMTIDDCDFFLSFSIGYAEYPTDARSVDELLTHANLAMTEAKHLTGIARICRYTPQMSDAERVLVMERKIRYALEHDNLFFHLQPQYDVEHNLIGFEALARMKDENGENISPGEFIPVAEETGLVDQIDTVVFRKSADFLGQLIRKTKTDITLSVNVSVKHLMKNGFLDEVREILSTYQVPAEQIEIEITESVMIDSVEKALQCINEIKKMGIKIAIDDFGTGYSSLSYLNSFPADVLKIDKSFIDQMNTSDSSRKYVASIISIGHIMNFKVISEGVEESDQLDTLRSIGCDYIQGFIWGRPLPPQEAEEVVLESA